MVRAAMLHELGYDPDDGRCSLTGLSEAHLRADGLGLAPGQIRAARHGADPVALVRTESGRLFVVPDECPHDGGLISDGYVEGETLVCSRHNREFDPATMQRCPRTCH